MNVIKGDLIELALAGEFDVIVHGCNCFCKMGAGIAKQIKTRFPQAYEVDCNTKKGDRSKLGTFSALMYKDKGLTIINAYTQYYYGGGKDTVNVDYGAVQSVFEKIAREFSNDRIGYPLIGAGLAGGSWRKISAIIDNVLFGLDHTLVKLT